MDKIFINSIAKDCGVNRITIYHNFENIYDIVKWTCIVDRPFLSGYDWSIINENSHQHRYIFNVNGEMRCGGEH